MKPYFRTFVFHNVITCGLELHLICYWISYVLISILSRWKYFGNIIFHQSTWTNFFKVWSEEKKSNVLKRQIPLVRKFSKYSNIIYLRLFMSPLTKRVLWSNVPIFNISIVYFTLKKKNSEYFDSIFYFFYSGY